MKKIETDGIRYLEVLKGSETQGERWYWGSDYTNGDLYEAEQIFVDKGFPIKSNRVIFVHYPEGKTLEPVKAQEGQYFGRPISYNGKLMLLLVDFPQDRIMILSVDPKTNSQEEVISISRSEIKDCYNLQIAVEPLMLIRQTVGEGLQIIWPQKQDYNMLEKTESFEFRKGNKLYLNAWHEDSMNPYTTIEEIIIRDYETGKILERTEGVIYDLPDGQRWILN